MLGLLGLMLQGSSGGHMLLVEHATCAEHGELIHAAGPHVHEAATEVGRSFRSTTDPERDATHDHCLLAAERRDATEPVADAWFTAVLRVETAETAEVSDTVLGEDAPRFHIAPKNSPPA